MAERPGVLFRFELLDALEQLSPADAGELFIAAMKYGKDGTAPTFQNPLLSVVWSFIKTAVDHDAEVYDGKILQRQHAVYCRECKRKGETPMDFDTWKSSSDIDRCVPITSDIHKQEHIQDQCQPHNQEQVQGQNQKGTAAEPPAPARDSRGVVFLDDGEYSALVADLGEQEVRRCVDYLSEYCITHNKRYHDWGLMIRRANREGWGLPPSKLPSGATKTPSPGTDFQPSLDRIKKNNDWLDAFLEEQRRKEAASDGQ